MKISYNWLKWYVPEIPEADKLSDVFMHHLCEVESVEKLADGDTLYDLNILPNRAHDLLSHHGIARELSGQLGIAYKDPAPYYKMPESKPTKLEIDVQTENCRRYTGRIIRNVKVGPSPEWVIKHLESIGQRSINNIVDATNLCMFDCGQPMHAFDLKKLASEKIVIRQAEEGETMTTLDAKPVVAKASDMVIADRAGVLALAGVKGGTKAQVDETTTDIVLEVANFDPATVRKTARRLGIFTDAAKRFENDLSPELAEFGMKELTGLIIETCPEATFEDIVDMYPKKQEARKLAFSLEYINKKLGSSISKSEVEDILQRYNFSYAGNYTVDVPALRLDLVGAHDMAEEIGRIYGYEKIAPQIPKIDFAPKMSEGYARMEAARTALLADGYSEVMTYTFGKKGKVEVARGAKGKEFLRTNLSDGLKESYELNRLNAPLLGEEEIKIFEIGTVFPERGGEEMRVAYADKKGVIESTLLEFTKNVSLLGEEGAGGGDLHSESPLDKGRKNARFVQWSLYPFIARDVAVWVPAGTKAEDLIALCKEQGTDLLIKEPQLFDQFTKGERTSLGVRMVFQSMDRTLTDHEITEIMAKISAAIAEKGWEIR